MKRLLVRLLYGNGKFRSYEQIIIDKVIQVLEPTTADILRHQLEASDIKQRSSLDKMLIIGFSFERLDYQGLLFPNRSDELRIATVKLRALNSRRQIKVEIVAAEGLIATMKFSHSPRELEDGFEIIEVEVGPAPQVPEVPVEPLDHVPASLSLHLSGY